MSDGSYAQLAQRRRLEQEVSLNEATALRVDRRRDVCRSLREIVVSRLDLPVEPDWLTDDQPLFGRGLELDSVDALELVAGIEWELDVAIDDDDAGVFGSINSIADYIERKREADGDGHD